MLCLTNCLTRAGSSSFSLRARHSGCRSPDNRPTRLPPAYRPTAPPEITAATATGPAAEVLALEQKIEAATVKGDTAFAETVLSSDFHFRHGDGWTRGEKTGGMEDDRAAYLKRIADKEYLVHDLDGTKIEMHGDLAITWGRYVSLFMPKNRNPATPGRLTTIWYERVWAKRDGRWQWLSHRTVWGPHNSPAGVDPTQVSEAHASSYVPGLPAANAPAESYKPETKEAAEILALEQKLGAAVPGGDQALFDSHTSDDFPHVAWRRLDERWSIAIDRHQTGVLRTGQEQAVPRVAFRLAQGRDARRRRHHLWAIRRHVEGSNPDRAWFSVWYERVYQKRNDRWMFLSQRTVHGASYGPTQESVSNK